MDFVIGLVLIWIAVKLRKIAKICEAKLAEYEAKLNEMDRQENRDRLACLPRDPFPRPGGPPTMSASR